MGRWLARGVAIAGIGGVLALGGGAAAFAEGGAAANTQTDPLSSLTKQLQASSKQLPAAQLPTLPLDPAELTKLLQNGAKSLSALQLPKLPDLSGLVPKTPLICGIGLGIANSTPVNGVCPGGRVVTVTKTVPKTRTRTVTKVVHVPAKTTTKVVQVPVNYQQPVAAAPTGKLAYTGFETTPVLAAGVAALIGGTVLTACARPRRRAARA